MPVATANFQPVGGGLRRLGLEGVELLMSKDWPGQNRGFCFLTFYNHACAQAAKAALSPPNFQ